jgi:ICP0-binding domain of Ubiquitin-specific protease 7/MATH domain/Ubiquitin carboxyl-terminal hydrolase/Ubiquitin-specific protease C-terminal
MSSKKKKNTVGSRVDHVEGTDYFRWVIKNYSELASDPQERHYSPVFSLGGYTWRVLLFSRGLNQSQYLSVYLEVAEQHRLPTGWVRHATFTLVAINQLDAAQQLKLSVTHDFRAKAADWGYKEFVSFRQLSDPAIGFVVNDTLILEANAATERQWVEANEYIERFVPGGDTAKRISGFAGLQNVGATQYLNSALQCLFHLAAFRRAFFDVDDVGELGGGAEQTAIANALQAVFYHLQCSETSGIDQSAFVDAFGWGHSFDSFVRRRNVRAFIERLLDVAAMPQLVELFASVDVAVAARAGGRVPSVDRDVFGHGNGGGDSDDENAAPPPPPPAPVLLVHLERFGHDERRGVNVMHNERFEYGAEARLSTGTDNDDDIVYDLHVVLVHSGEVHGGHYYAFVRPTPDGAWIKFDDERATPATAEHAIDDNFGGDRTRFATAYMLLYARRDCVRNAQLIAPFDTDTHVPAQLVARFERERVEGERQRLAEAEAHLYMELRVACAADLERHDHTAFDLVAFEPAADIADGDDLPPEFARRLLRRERERQQQYSERQESKEARGEDDDGGHEDDEGESSSSPSSSSAAASSSSSSAAVSSSDGTSASTSFRGQPRRFKVKKSDTLDAWKAIAETEFGVPVARQRFWRWARRVNGTYRVHSALSAEQERERVSALRHGDHLDLFLEDADPVMGQNGDPSPPPVRDIDDILLFIKYYDVESGARGDAPLRFVGTTGALDRNSCTVAELASLCQRSVGLDASDRVALFEEVSGSRIDTIAGQMLADAALSTGDVVVFERYTDASPSSSTTTSSGLVAALPPSCVDYYRYIAERITVEFRPLPESAHRSVPPFSLELTKSMSYDQLARAVANHLGSAGGNPLTLRFTGYNPVLGEPRALPHKRRGGPANVAAMLLFYHGSLHPAVLFVELLSSSIDDFERQRSIRVAWQQLDGADVERHELLVAPSGSLDDAVAELCRASPAVAKAAPRIRIAEVHRGVVQRDYTDSLRTAVAIVSGFSRFVAEPFDSCADDSKATVHGAARIRLSAPSNGSTADAPRPVIEGNAFLVSVRLSDTCASLSARLASRLSIDIDAFDLVAVRRDLSAVYRRFRADAIVDNLDQSTDFIGVQLN